MSYDPVPSSPQFPDQRPNKSNLKILLIVLIAVVLVVGSGIGIFVHVASRVVHVVPRQTTVPITAQLSTQPVYDPRYQPIDNIYCNQLEGTVEHIHVLLNISIDDQLFAVPQYVGIPVDAQTGLAPCFYWLHTHDNSGVIHIESPTIQSFTLGQFIDEWNQGFKSLGFPAQLLLPDGWTVYVNGSAYTGAFRSLPLHTHDIISLGYNSPNMTPVTTYNWGAL